MSEWVLVPREPSEDMIDAATTEYVEHGYWWSSTLKAAIAARPSIPADVLEQMVERGARAMAELNGYDGPDGWKSYTDDAGACLRAALGDKP